MNIRIVVLVITAIGASGWIAGVVARDLWLVITSARQDRKTARMCQRPGGIVAWETPEPRSDGAMCWHQFTRYARNEYELLGLLETVPSLARDVQVIRDYCPQNDH